jgi:hypothetical protein
MDGFLAQIFDIMTTDVGAAHYPLAAGLIDLPGDQLSAGVGKRGGYRTSARTIFTEIRVDFTE